MRRKWYVRIKKVCEVSLIVVVLMIGLSALARVGTALSEAASHEQQTGWVTTGSSNSESQPAMLRSAAISSTGTFTAYLPYVSRSAPELHGTVTLRGEPVSDVTITLYKCCYPFSPGIGSIRIQTATTDAGGRYNFTGVPSLTSDEDKVYFAQYADVTADPSRLSKWTTAHLSTYETGSTASLGTFDISNVTLVEPEAGIATSPPITFRWVPRATVLSDTYGIVIIYPPWECYVNQLSYVDSYTLEPGTPPNLCSVWPGHQYLWTVRVYGPDGGYGDAELRGINIDFSE